VSDMPVYANASVPRGKVLTYPAGHPALVELGIDIPAGTWASVIHPDHLQLEYVDDRPIEETP
jgi:hypothetical protein